jgi:hypothetical protein
MRNKNNTVIEVPVSTRDLLQKVAEWDHRTMKGEILHIIEYYRQGKYIAAIDKIFDEAENKEEGK